jgi:hypothetical protein
MPAKGDGISKRRDDRYMARYTVHTPDGVAQDHLRKEVQEAEKKLNAARVDVARRQRSSASEAARSAHMRFAWLTSDAESQASLMTETCAWARGDTTIPGRAACCLAEAFSANLSRKPQSASTLPMFTILLLFVYYLFTSFGILMVRVRR